MTPPGPQIDLQREMTEKLVTHSNVRQVLIITTADKLKLCLLEHKDLLRSRREWLAPFGLLLSMVATLVAAEFKETALGLPAPTWQAIFVICAGGASIATIWLFVRAVRSFLKGGVEELIDKIAARNSASSFDPAELIDFISPLDGRTLLESLRKSGGKP